MPPPPCPLCTRASTTAPTHAATLWRDPHDDIGLCTCPCGRPWLCLGTEIFDDLWTFHAPLTDAEPAALTAAAQDASSAPLRNLAYAILRRQTILSRGPSGAHWVDGATAKLDGPPW